MGFELTLVMIGTDCLGSCKYNYNKIKTTTASILIATLHFLCAKIFSHMYIYIKFSILPWYQFIANV
jgi:hypothetical protein